MNEKPSLICIQETRWSSKTKVKIPGYDIIKIDRTSKGGGVAIFINLDIFQVIETIDISDSLRNVESVIVKSLRKDGKYYSFANIYNNKGSNAIKDYLSLIYTKMDGLKIFLGDFNAHSYLWETNAGLNRAGKDLTDFLKYNVDISILTPANTPTYGSMIGTYSSAIDLTFVSNQIYQDSDCNLRDDIEIGTPHKLIEINFGCIRGPPVNPK